ncbi:unnamed protein product [Rotaria magnacalcarata]|uniref:Cadherin domain-containing protein n=2 Tax=Rotaria magnacalcarata TaxID=392030 RepID=A0A818XI08_9BILA|nr:unnamed protein product [Rotaria magnacalcarata]CAF3737288.1 unnamed protein product [Rotaria magnacalcarata]
MLRFLLIIFLVFISSTLSSRLKYRASVKENVNLYHTITSLDKMLSVNYQQSIEFLNLNSPYTTYFLVDGQKLRTSRLIDREEFCRIRLCENSLCHPCEIEMDFVLKENGQPRDIISLILTVEDVNEFRPQFLDVSSNGHIIQLNISEGVPVGHVLPIPSATDKDGEDDELIYWLEKTAKLPFELVSFGSNQIALNVTEPLDREIRDFYEVKLTASDRGNLTSTIPIHISISDINDNVPAFDQQYPYTINISENTLPSLTKSLIRIHAVDNDSNDNSHISYQFSPQISELIRQTFQLNSETGELFLLQSLDFEQYKEYRIQVTAQDSGPVSVPVYTTIIVSVEDENDNAPIMNIRVSEYFHLINDTLYISEETPLNTLLMHIIVQDFDLNLNGKVQCWIEPSKPKFNITNTINNMFAVYTEELFDREQHSNYSIVLIVEDNGLKNRHRTVRALQLIITDINDSPPIFTQPFYSVTIEEEKEYKQAIIQIHANDADLNENSQISYELITKEYKYLFNLDEKTGEIFLENKLDREIKSEYNLTIRAYDHGQYPKQLSTDVSVYIYLLDNNEFKPQFEHNTYIFHNISETISVNSSIGFVKAIDNDNNIITYSILSSDLMINSLTGEILLRKQLDYDTSPCINAIVIANDNGGYNSTCQIEICLKPINEFSPELHPESRLIYVNIDNTSLIHLNANDRDRSPSSFISYQYGQVSKCNLTFLYLSSNGTIYLNKKEECTGIIDLMILISDNDQYPSAKLTNQTIRLIFYSNLTPLKQVLSQASLSKFSYKKFQNFSWEIITIEMIIIFIIIIILIFILLIVCLITCITYRRRKLSKHLLKPTKLHIKQSPSPLINLSQKRLTLLTSSSQASKDRICFTENHCLLSDGSLANDMSTNSPYTKLQQSIKTNGNSDTSSSYNDSCYGSSEMDVCHHNHHHHHHQSIGNKLVKQDIAITTPMTETTGKILLSSNENYIIVCKDSSASSDETNSSSPTSSSSSSPTTNNNSLITTCQPNKRTGTTQQYRTQLKSKSDQSNKKIDFFQNDDEYRKVLGSAASFNYRNITPLNEYYL